MLQVKRDAELWTVGDSYEEKNGQNTWSKQPEANIFLKLYKNTSKWKRQLQEELADN